MSAPIPTTLAAGTLGVASARPRAARANSRILGEELAYSPQRLKQRIACRLGSAGYCLVKESLHQIGEDVTFENLLVFYVDDRGPNGAGNHLVRVLEEVRIVRRAVGVGHDRRYIDRPRRPARSGALLIVRDMGRYICGVRRLTAHLYRYQPPSLSCSSTHPLGDSPLSAMS